MFQPHKRRLISLIYEWVNCMHRRDEFNVNLPDIVFNGKIKQSKVHECERSARVEQVIRVFGRAKAKIDRMCLSLI